MPDRMRFMLNVCAVAALLAAPVAAQAAPHAHFELRLTSGQDDSILTLSDPQDRSLELEIWVQITDVTAGVRATAYSFFLDCNTSGVIEFAGVFSSPAFTFGCAAAGMDDQPDTGDFGRACVDPVGTTVGMGSAGLWAQFEVAALNVGNAAYIFNDTGNNRVWRVTLSNGTTLQGSSLSFSIAPNVSLISVVQQAISADADADGDVDLNDYSTLIACAKESRPAAEGVCARLDLAQDGVIDLDDLVEFVPLLTGPSGSTKAPGHDKAEIAGERVVEAIALQKTADDCHPSEKRP